MTNIRPLGRLLGTVPALPRNRGEAEMLAHRKNQEVQQKRLSDDEAHAEFDRQLNDLIDQTRRFGPVRSVRATPQDRQTALPAKTIVSPRPSSAPPEDRARPRQSSTPQINISQVYRDLNSPQMNEAVKEVLEIQSRTGANVIGRIADVAARQSSAPARSFSQMAASAYGGMNGSTDGLIQTSLRGGGR